jgi:hypothetical protein
MRRLALFLAIVVCLYVKADCAAPKKKSNIAETQRALTYLLSAAEEKIPPASSCYGSFGQSGQPAIKDLIAMELSSLWAGKNLIVGACTNSGATQCSVTISHEQGEAVSSAKISYDIEQGKVDLKSLKCVLSP